MTAHELVVDVLVGIGVAIETACALGVLVARDALARLIYAGASTSLAPGVLAAAVIVEEGLTQPGVNAIAVACILFVFNAVVVNATARAVRTRRARSGL